MKKITVLTLLMFAFSAMSQNLWQNLSGRASNFNEENLQFRKNMPKEFNRYSLDLQGFKDRTMSLGNRSVVIQLPTASGKIEKFSITIASSLSLELQAKYPMIQSFIATGIDNPTSTARISIGTDGLHASIYVPGKETYYIDPYLKNNMEYISYGRNSLERSADDFQCLVEGQLNQPITPVASRNADDGKLRIFRAAIATTGEYSKFHLTNQNVGLFATEAEKKVAVLSAINTTITRVNVVYERDLGVRLVLVPNNDDLIFFKASEDPFTNNSSQTLIGESQTEITNRIGNANFDIGHTFSTGAGGLARRPSVCVNGNKASGVTGVAAPIGDPYDIDFVAHEIGHQFGGNHTFNGDVNSCGNNNRSDATAVEPGSGTTIMGYAGICGSQNVQLHSDDHFHAISIAEIWAHIQGAGNCADATATNTGNAIPTADAGADYTIPRLTPFVLKGKATDANNGLGSLEYTWEQTDTEISIQPPLETNTGGPNFRSFPRSASPDRYMPKLTTLLAGYTSSTWEVLTSKSRDMNFAFVVRDNNPGGGASVRDDVKISTALFAGPFTVTSQPTAVTWIANSSATVTWNVKNTSNAPVNCTKVNIKFSTDGGLTYPTTILADTPNDGTQEVIVPNINTTTGRIMVEAVDNIFFNINAGVIQIENAIASVEDFVFSGFSLYPNPSNGEINIAFDVLNTENVSLQLYDIRGRKVGEKTYKNVSSQFSEKLVFDKVLSGIYLLKITNGGQKSTRKIIIE